MRGGWMGAALAFALAAAPALADDGSASLAAGGIVFTKNADIRLAAEDLYISPAEVRVRMEFVNDTARDVDTVVAFPLPDIDLYDIWRTESGPQIGDFFDLARTGDAPPIVARDPVNFVRFTAAVDGKAVSFQTEQRALIGTRDVTGIVTAQGLPVNVLVAGWKALDRLTDVQRKRLTDAGVLEDKDGPKWRVVTRFYWHQRFPAHARVVIAHTYRPVTGTFNTPDAAVEAPDFIRNYCIDWRTRANLFAHSNTLFTDYVLKTANTWKGPIGRFHLTLDKLGTWNSLALCWDGALWRTGLTTYEFWADDYTPTRDVHMMVVE